MRKKREGVPSTGEIDREKVTGILRQTKLDNKQ